MIGTQTVGTNGLSFNVDVAGDSSRPLVLLLHGFPHSSYSWRHQLPELARNGYFAVAPNQRGYSEGARPSGVQSYALDHLVADAIGIAEGLGHQRFHLVGHDWGGQVAWLVAARWPQRVRSLVVLSRPHPSAFKHALANDPEQRMRSIHHRRFQDADMVERLLTNGMERLRALLRYESLAALFDDEVLVSASTGAQPRMSSEDAQAYCNAVSQPGALEAALNWYRAGFSGDSALANSEIGPIKVPTLLLWGTQDVSVGRVAAQSTALHVDAPFRLQELDGMGHFLCDQCSELVSTYLMQHLQEHATR